MQCKLIQENKLTDRQSFYIDLKDYELNQVINGYKVNLLSGIDAHGLINYAAISEVKNCFGIKSGYIIVIGEQ